MNESSYFLISEEIILNRKIFPYHLYIFNPITEEYSPFLPSNTPMINAKLSFLKRIIQSNGRIAILISQKKTFLRAHELKEDEVPSLQDKTTEVSPILDQHTEKKSKILKQLNESNISIAEMLVSSIENDDFLPIIKQARNEISILSIKINQTVSMAVKLSETLMDKDTQNNRIVALSFLIAKECNIKDSKSIGDLITAAFLHHIGYTQIDSSLTSTPFSKLSDQQKKDFRNHAGLSHHLVRKSNIDLTPRCTKLILQHHERYNGLGYPEQTIGTFIEPMSLILGCASHICEFSNGKIIEKKRNIETVIKMISQMNTEFGLELSFGDYVHSSLKIILENISNFDKNNKQIDHQLKQAA